MALEISKNKLTSRLKFCNVQALVIINPNRMSVTAYTCRKHYDDVSDVLCEKVPNIYSKFIRTTDKHFLCVNGQEVTVVETPYERDEGEEILVCPRNNFFKKLIRMMSKHD